MATTHTLPGPEDTLRVELDNGIIVLARENFTSPSVVIDGVLRGGALYESAEKAGLANFHSEMLQRGTKSHPFHDFYEVIEGMGADLGINNGRQTYSFDGKSLAEDLPVMLGLLAEMLREPAIPEDDIEKVRGQIMTRLQMQAHDTRSMANRAFRELVYGKDHGYGRPISGYLETVPGLTREDVLAQHSKLGPKGMIVTVVGAVKAQDAVQMVKDALGDWSNPEQAEKPDAPPAPVIEETRQQFIPIAGKTQADIVMGTQGPARSAVDFQAARIGNSILGVFGLMGRLGDNVREAQGLAYYSYSQMRGGLAPGGPWLLAAGVDPANVEKATNSMRDEVRRMVDEPVTDEELADNKTFFKGHLLLSLETNDNVASTMVNMELYDLGLDYLQQYEAMIDGITKDDVQAAAAHYLDPDAYALAVAGPENGQ